jgi:SNF2 family DNA or RNA helicase
VDEISKFKHSNSGRFQVLKPHLNKFARRWGLTGSPAPNGLLDLFGIMYVLDLGRSLGQYITHYRASYFYPTGYGGYTWALRPEAEEQIYERIGPVVYRIAEEDYLKLPKLVENTIKIELPKPVRKIYDELENDLITMLEDNTVTAVNAAVASVKCSQVANGGLFLNQEINDLGQKVGKREWQNLHEEKLDAVEDIIEELNGAPVIVVYDYEHDLERLLKRFGKDTPVIGGGVSPKKSDQIVDAWNRGEIPILLGHPQAMSHGLNLQDNNSQHIIWHSICWDYELFDQLTRRLLRSGNTSEKVFNHFIVAKDTVDEAKLLALKRKKRTQGSLLDAMKEYSQQRRLQRSGK